MRIESYKIDQMATSKLRQTEKTYVNVQIQQKENEADVLDISKEGLQLNEVEEDSFLMLSDEDKRKIDLLESFMSWLTGKKVKFKRFYSEGKDGIQEKNINKANNKLLKKMNRIKPKEVKNTDFKNMDLPDGMGIRVHKVYEKHEKEQMSFSSQGVVKTSDGVEINFSYNLNMSRETYERSESLLEIGEKFHDPLVINYDGKGVDFSDKSIEIDIDLDGELDNIRMLANGNGFLALDLNNNGKVDDGSEMFGPQTNNGFDELRAFDLDENAWIDENDEIFDSLKIWTLDSDGNHELIGLKDSGVGAIYLGNVASKFTIVDGSESLAKITGSSIYLSEDGKANGVHEVDLKL